MKEKYKHLIIDKRMCGNTTRLIDAFIQTLFNEGEVTIFDHCQDAMVVKDRLNHRIADTIINRLRGEHRLNVLIDKKHSKSVSTKHVYFNPKKWTFKLIE
jgi:hypothetical protein